MSLWWPPWRHTTQHCKCMDIVRNSHYLSSHRRSMHYAAENAKPHHSWETSCLLDFAMGCPTGVHVTLYLVWWGKYSISTGILLSCASWTCKMHYPWNEISISEWCWFHSKDIPCLAYPIPSLPPHTWQRCLPWPSSMVYTTGSSF